MRRLALLPIALLLASALPAHAALPLPTDPPPGPAQGPWTDPADTWPTPGLACQLGDVAPTQRIVPEPYATNDYISYPDAKDCLEAVARAAPRTMELKTIGQSAGWDLVTGGRQTYDVWLVEITNKDSAIPFEHRIKHVFQLSVHGNEKGGREGGLRVIEDLARCLQTPGAITAQVPQLCHWLDWMVAIFTFPNPDGWVHEELEVFLANPGTGYVRGNGNGFDLNRQWPNKGWTREAYRTLSQPEIVASLHALMGYTNIATATDIHGMLTPTDADITGEVNRLPEQRRYEPGGSLLEGLLTAGKADALKTFKTTRLAELLKERVNNDPELLAWSGLPATGAWGGQVMEWGTSWDTIGYVDSGFTGDFFYQEHGLNAASIDFELAYNHMVCDNHYLPCGQVMNILHTRLVRQIVAVFMESATKDVHLSLETGGVRAAWLDNPRVVTSLDAEGRPEPVTGWAAQNPDDDAFDYGNTPFTVHLNQYFLDLQRYLRDGDRPGVLERLDPRAIGEGALERFDVLIIAGSAYERVAHDAQLLALIDAWVQAGGTLVLTDAALQYLDDVVFGEGPSAVQLRNVYAGHTNFERHDHPLAAGLRGMARQTYEPVPIGYGGGQAPTWTVVRAAVASAGGTVVGSVGGSGPNLVASSPGTPGTPNYGEVPRGDGTIRFLGALLPDPTREYYHPYGLDPYATTYTGNQLLMNMVGWHTVYSEPPVVVEDLGKHTPALGGDGSAGAPSEDAKRSVPGPGLALVALAVGVAVLARRRHWM